MFQRILCATDFSDTAEAAWEAACELARVHRAELILVHAFVELPVYPEVAVVEVQRVWDEQRRWVEGELEQRAAAARARGLGVRWMLKTGPPAEGIVEAVGEAQADVLVIGTHGRTGLTRLLIGSVAERVVRIAPVPVLIVKPPATGQAAREVRRAA
jgi:universal stress protein A